MKKKIVITGATGLIGQSLCRALINRGDELTVFTRDRESSKKIIPGAIEHVAWDYRVTGEWTKHIEGKDAVIHLAGANVFGRRWNEEYKKEILKSRELGTHNLVSAIASAGSKPSTFISSSAVGYYGDRGNEILEDASSSGEVLIAHVCISWEKEAEAVEQAGIRRVSVRTGLVLSKEGGFLQRLLLPFKMFVGGPIGNGAQWLPWLHIEDMVRIYLFALDNTAVSGPVNAASPNPVTMKEFARLLGKTMHRPSLFPVPKAALRIVLGEAAQVAASSQRAIPQKLQRTGYKFKFEQAEDALRDLLKN